MRKNYFAILVILSIILIIPACTISDNDDDDFVDPRTKFYGIWSVNETCNKRIYSVTIKEDPNNSSRVLVENFADPGFGDPAIGIVANNRITLDPSYKIGDDWTVTGTGNYISNTRLEWDFELIIAGSQQSCHAVYSK